MTEKKQPANMPLLHESNQLRSLAGAKRQVARAEHALTVIHRADLADPSPVRRRYEKALRLRLLHPEASLLELATLAGMSKHRFWRTLARALDCADRLEAKQKESA